VTAPDTVPLCLWVASRHVESFQGAIWETVSALGDRDTTVPSSGASWRWANGDSRRVACSAGAAADLTRPAGGPGPRGPTHDTFHDEGEDVKTLRNTLLCAWLAWYGASGIVHGA